jgi:hypothetical protein
MNRPSAKILILASLLPLLGCLSTHLTVLVAKVSLVLMSFLFATVLILSYLEKPPLLNQNNLKKRSHVVTFIGFLYSLLSFLTYTVIASITICLLSKINSPRDFIELALLSIPTILLSGKSKETLCLLKSSPGPLLFTCYILWVGLANNLNQESTNLQIPYYLSLGIIAIFLAVFMETPKQKYFMVCTISLAVILTWTNKFIGLELLGLHWIISYKNYAAISGLLALSMLLAIPKSKSSLLLAYCLSFCLMIGPSTLHKLGIGTQRSEESHYILGGSTLGQIGTILLWTLFLWLKLPAWTRKKKVPINWKPKLLPYFRILPIAIAMLMAGLMLSNIETISKMMSKNKNLNGRLDNWKTSISWIAHSPIIGNGPNFWIEKGKMTSQNTPYQGHISRSDNCLLDPSVQSGIPASILIITTLLLSLKCTNLRIQSKYYLLLGLLLSLISETHSIFGAPPQLGDGIICAWIAFIWSHSTFSKYKY